MFDLTDKTVFITGGAGSLGKSMGLALGRSGARIIIAGIENEEQVSVVKEEFMKENIKIIHEHLDVTSIENIEEVVSKYEVIDVLINCAGINARNPILDTNEGDWERVIDVNLKGAFFTSKMVAKKMITRKSGKIINMGSLSSYIGLPNMGPYCASKGGINQLTKAMAVEWAPHIQVNAIAPGYFHTELTAPLFENREWREKTLSRIPTGRTGKPEDLNGIALLLASSASDYITGQTIYVDGGWTAS